MKTFLIFLLVLGIFLGIGFLISPEPEPTICTPQLEKKSVEMVHMLLYDSPSYDIRFPKQKFDPVLVNRNADWNIFWNMADFEVKKTAVRWIGIYNNCLHYPSKGWEKYDVPVIELRDLHTNEKFASIGMMGGLSLHD